MPESMLIPNLKSNLFHHKAIQNIQLAKLQNYESFEFFTLSECDRRQLVDFIALFI